MTAESGAGVQGQQFRFPDTDEYRRIREFAEASREHHAFIDTKGTQQDAVEALMRAGIIQPTLPSARKNRGDWVLTALGESITRTGDSA